MNNFFKNIVEWFKQIFGIRPEEKTAQEIDSDFFDNKLSLTSVLAERLTTLTVSDNEINVIGDNARAKYINDFIEWLDNTKLNAIAQVCLGTGDCIARPNTDGKRIGLDIIPNDKFVIVDAVGDYIYGLLVKCDEIKTDNNDLYERWEYMKLSEDANGVPYESITQVAFKNGKKINIAEVEAWAGLKDNQLIPNVDRLLLGRFKCPKINRKDVNSANGVPITAGNEYVVEQAKASYARFNEEFAKSEKFLFADKRVFKAKKVRKADGSTEEVSTLPDGKENVIMTVNGSTQVDGSPLMHEFNPAIRQAELSAGIQENLKMLELVCGFDTGILSESNTKYENLDATRKSVQNTFAFITTFRKVLEQGITDLVYAVNVICNFNNLTPMGNYDIDYNWSDSFVENMAERFNELLQAHAINAVTTAEVRSWVMDVDLELAEQQLQEQAENAMIEE